MVKLLVKSFLFVVLSLFVVACGGEPATEAEASSITSSTASDGVSVESVGPFVPNGSEETRIIGVYPQEIRNCLEGNDPIINEPSRTRATNHVIEWEVGGEVGTGISIDANILPIGSFSPGEIGVDLSASMMASYGEEWQQSEEQGEGWELPGKSGEITTYLLEWSEVWQPGQIEVLFSNQDVLVINVNYRSRISSRIVDEDQISCEASDDTGIIVPIFTDMEATLLNDGTTFNRSPEGLNLEVNSSTNESLSQLYNNARDVFILLEEDFGRVSGTVLVYKQVEDCLSEGMTSISIATALYRDRNGVASAQEWFHQKDTEYASFVETGESISIGDKSWLSWHEFVDDSCDPVVEIRRLILRFYLHNVSVVISLDSVKDTVTDESLIETVENFAELVEFKIETVAVR